MVFRRPPVTRRSLAQNSLLAFATAAFVTSTPLTLALAQPAAGLATPEASAAHESAFAIPADDARDREVYRQHLMLLSDPFMEGRGPGTKGNRIAADYLAFHFQRLGLKPAFAEKTPGDEKGAAAGEQHNEDHSAGAPTYFQEFRAGREAIASESVLSLNTPSGPVEFKAGSEYTVLGFSADADLPDAPLAFVGYSLERTAKDGAKYSSYSESENLNGKVAVMLRFEPMDKDGKSLWRDADVTSAGWSPAAGLAGKLQSAIQRGVSAIIVINTPGADDERVKKLDSTAATANWSRKLDVPVLMISPEAGERLIKATDPKGRSLMDLRRWADTMPAPEAGAPATIDLAKATARLVTKIERRPRITWNVGGVLPGFGPLADEYIVVGAHFDHVGYGYTGGSRTGELGVIHPGADDNASGTSGMLLSADLLSRAYAKLRDGYNPAQGKGARSILFLGFSAEEMGLIGSQEFVRNAPIEASKLVAMLNMDMIGRSKDRSLEIGGTGTAEGLADIVLPNFEAPVAGMLGAATSGNEPATSGGADVSSSGGFTVKASPGGRGPSDHASFYSAGIPVLFFFTGLHEQYHTPRDVATLIDINDATDIAQCVAMTALNIAERPEPLKFTSTDKAKGGDAAQTSMKNVKVRFGIAPGNYADGEEGVLVGEVYPNTSAAVAGIHEGDRLLKWNGHDIGDVAAWMTQLSQHKPGDVVEVTVQRKGKTADQTEVVPVTLKAREAADQ